MDLVRVIEILHDEIDNIEYMIKNGDNPKKYNHQLLAVERVKDIIVTEMISNNNKIAMGMK